MWHWGMESLNRGKMKMKMRKKICGIRQAQPTSEGKDKRWPGRREGREREKKGISVDNNDKNKQTKKYHFNRR